MYMFKSGIVHLWILMSAKSKKGVCFPGPQIIGVFHLPDMSTECPQYTVVFLSYICIYLCIKQIFKFCVQLLTWDKFFKW